jgi:hypothetical protein
MIQFRVHGRPGGAGSKTAYRKGGKVVLVQDSIKTKTWMEAVKWAAIEAGFHRGHLLEGPIKLTIEFYVDRPTSHLTQTRKRS